SLGLTYSRAGCDAPTRAMKPVACRLKLELSQFRELQAFASFGSDLDKATQATLDRGRRLTEILKQRQYEPRTLAAEVTALFAATNGYLDKVPVARVVAWEEAFIKYMETTYPDINKTIMDEKQLSDDTIAKLRAAIEAFNRSWSG
ncbi:MAG: F0F1 ATP synthase subunit alpha, partial [Candidatus Roseilinea sp.]